jgi:hypothetical protein
MDIKNNTHAIKTGMALLIKWTTAVWKSGELFMSGTGGFLFTN